MEVLDPKTRAFLLLSSIFLPIILCGPQYSLSYGGSELDQGTLDDIFGDSVRAGYGAEDEEDEWVTVPVNLLPGDEGCSTMQGPISEPKMLEHHEEYKPIEVVRAQVNKKCDYYTETQGFECVPYYQCEDGTIVTDGAGLIDVRFGGDGPELAVLDSTDLMCAGSLDVCCKNPDFVKKDDFSQQIQEPVDVSSEDLRDGDGQELETGELSRDEYSEEESSEESSEESEEEPVEQPPVPEEEPVQEEELVQEPVTEKEFEQVEVEVPPGEQEPEPVPGPEKEKIVAPEPKSYIPSCGKRNSNGLGVKVSGYKDDEAQFGEWPHICAVLKKEIVTVVVGGEQQQQQQEQQQQKEQLVEEEEILVFLAGASLIAPGVLLTAAHKVQDLMANPGNLVVRCGEWDTQTEGEPLAHQDRTVGHIVLHPEFNSRNLGNTIALLFLTEEFELADHIDTICLPSYLETFDSSQDCYVKGWGKDIFGKEGQYQVVLKEVKLPMVSDSQCLTWLRATRLGRRFRLDESFVCAGGIAGKDACRGDGGGPLVCPKKDDPSRFVQVGIVAWGIGCGEENVPGVYTAVAEQVCWIDWAMRCYLGEAYTLQFGHQCQAWLAGKQAHRVPVLSDIYSECSVTWPEPKSLPVTQQVEQVEDLSGAGRKNTGVSTLPERITSNTSKTTKTNSPQTKGTKDSKGAPKTGGY